MKTEIIINDKTIVTFIENAITVNFARAWLKKKGLNPKEFCIRTEINSSSFIFRFTMDEKFDKKNL